MNKLIATIGSAAVAFTSVSASVPAPPPRPVAEDPRLEEALKEAETCYFRQSPIEAKARFAAEAATRYLDAEPGSARWLAARLTVIAYLNSRKATMACITRLVQFRPTTNVRDFKIWHNAYRHWLSAYERQTRFQLAIIEKLTIGEAGEWELERPYFES